MLKHVYPLIMTSAQYQHMPGPQRPNSVCNKDNSGSLDAAGEYTTVQNTLRGAVRSYDQGFGPGSGSRIMQKSYPNCQQTAKPQTSTSGSRDLTSHPSPSTPSSHLI